jgi:hypothetical protein
MSTWSKARETFGEGVPQTGEHFDQSGPLRQMQTTVESAAPGSRWSGTAASAYGTANTDHGNVIGQVAGLDQRLGAQVTQTANIVQTGRQNLDAVRQWVQDAAASVPAGKNREQLLLPIVQKGLGQVQDVITTSNGQLNAVAGDVKKLGGEYQALGTQKFGPKEGPDLQGVKGDDEDKKKSPSEQGAADSEALQNGKLTPEQQERLANNTHLTLEQQTALDQGKLVLPPERMSYLQGFSREFGDKAPAEIKRHHGQIRGGRRTGRGRVSAGLEPQHHDRASADAATVDRPSVQWWQIRTPRRHSEGARRSGDDPAHVERSLPGWSMDRPAGADGTTAADAGTQRPGQHRATGRPQPAARHGTRLRADGEKPRNA